MVLFVRGEDQVVEHFTAGDRRIIAEKGVEQLGAEFKVRIVTHDKTERFAAVKDMAAETDNTINQFHPFADPGRGLFRRVYGQVL